MTFLSKLSKLPRAVYFIAAGLVFGSVLTLNLFFWPSSASASVGTSTVNNALPNNMQSSIVTASTGTLVAFYYDGSHIVYRTSSNAGSSWSSAVTAVTPDPTVVTTADFSVTIDSSNNIYLSYTDMASSFNASSGGYESIWFKKLTYSAGSWSTGSASEAIPSTGDCMGTGSATTFWNGSTIAVNTSGKIFIAAADFVLTTSGCGALQPGSAQLTTVNSSNGSSWSGGTSLGSASAATSPLISIGSQIWLVNRNSGIYEDATSSGTFTQKNSTTYANTPVLTSDGSNQIDFAYKNSSNNLVYRQYIISSGSLSAETVISSGTSDLLGGISADSATGRLWIFYDSFVGTNSYNVTYKTSTDSGASWGSAVGVTTDNANNRGGTAQLSLNAGGNPTILWVSGTASPYTINSSTITGPPSPPSLIYPASLTPGVALQPTFRLRSSTSFNTYLRYQIIVYQSDCTTVLHTITQDGTTGGNTGWSGQDQQSGTAYTGSSLLSGSTVAKYTYQFSDFTNNTVYCWKAAAIDPAGTNTYGSYSAAQQFAVVPSAGVLIKSGTTIKSGVTIH
jgi:hypothetical protein